MFLLPLLSVLALHITPHHAFSVVRTNAPSFTNTAVVTTHHNTNAALRLPSRRQLTPPTTSWSKTNYRSISNSNNSRLYASESGDNNENDAYFDSKTTLTLIGAQSLLIVVSVIASIALKTPNYGLGSEFSLTPSSFALGTLYSLPLFLLAFVLDIFEKDIPALQNVTKATQRSVLALLGSKRKPLTALVVAVGLGAAAGIGEEMLFRGVLQSALVNKVGMVGGVGVTSVVFGALHAVTPLYAGLAALASVFFGWVYASVGNLGVAIVCHGVYDVGALLWAHWTVTGMTDEERRSIMEED